MSTRPILVATHSNNPVSRAVIHALEKHSQKPYIIYTDAICEGSTSFLYEFKNGQPLLSYDKWQLNLAEVGSAWYWRAIVKHHNSDIEREMQKTLWGTWEAIDEAAWLNHPYRIKRTQNKLMQLRYAHEAGLTVTPSVATNSHDQLITSLPDTFIAKMPGKGILYKDNDLNVLYSTSVGKDFTYTEASPFPGMYQPFLSKKKEWRVTIVGDRVFAAAIYTDASSKVD